MRFALGAHHDFIFGFFEFFHADFLLSALELQIKAASFTKLAKSAPEKPGVAPRQYRRIDAI